MPKKKMFSREQVQAAALALVDNEGLSALTMRNLAMALNTGPMTIYNYVRNRAELEALLVDAVMEQAGPTAPAEADWKDRIRDIADSIWRAVRAHPNAIPLILNRRSTNASTLEPIEAMLAALAAGGFKGAELLVAFHSITSFLNGFAQGELSAPLAGRDKAEIIERFQSLPVERYPLLVEVATAAANMAPEDEFRAGLDLILAGLEVRFRVK